MSHENKTRMPDARRFPRFAGVSTFCRFPMIDSLAAPPDWAVYGIPFDSGVTYRPGARFGPRAIREQSAYVKPFHLEHRLNLIERLSLCDAGDAPVQPYSTRATQDAATEFALSIGDDQTKLFAVGGDHSIALANLRATRRRHGADRPLALIHFDSHLDTVDQVWGEKYTHASVFVRAIEEELVDPTRMLSVGVKGPLNSETDLDYGRDQGIELVTYDDCRNDDGAERIIAFIDERCDAGDPVYLTFDIDVIDPAYAPGTGTPSVGGFTSAEALDLIRSLAGINLVGADVVEVLPQSDPGGVTAFLAAHILFEILCIGALREV
ncbi:MAG: agmatinase [Phycisphaerales bacterium]